MFFTNSISGISVYFCRSVLTKSLDLFGRNCNGGRPFSEAFGCNSSLMVPMGSWWREAENIKECCITQAQSPNFFDDSNLVESFQSSFSSQICKGIILDTSRVSLFADDVMYFFFSLSSQQYEQEQTSSSHIIFQISGMFGWRLLSYFSRHIFQVCI